MTIDEAIKHAEEVAKKNEQIAFDLTTTFNRETINSKECKKCAEEHRQLAEWLKDYKRLKEQNRWIPVSERLPEDHEKVLVTLSTGRVTIASYDNHRLSFDNRPIGWGVDLKNVVLLAWMPFLPEPYKAESENKE